MILKRASEAGIDRTPERVLIDGTTLQTRPPSVANRAQIAIRGGLGGKWIQRKDARARSRRRVGPVLAFELCVLAPWRLCVPSDSHSNAGCCCQRRRVLTHHGETGSGCRMPSKLLCDVDSLRLVLFVVSFLPLLSVVPIFRRFRIGLSRPLPIDQCSLVRCLSLADHHL